MLVNKNGANIIFRALNGVGRDISALYSLSAYVIGLILSVSSIKKMCLSPERALYSTVIMDIKRLIIIPILHIKNIIIKVIPKYYPWSAYIISLKVNTPNEA